MGTKRKVSAGQRPARPDDRPVYDSYARLSWNPNTRELEKIEDQWSDNTGVIDRLGGVLGEQLSDGLSAWKRTVRRPGWSVPVLSSSLITSHGRRECHAPWRFASTARGPPIASLSGVLAVPSQATPHA